jgi:hypothetical protein
MKAAGLLGGGAEHGSGTAPTGFVPGQTEEVEDQPNVSPEEQQEYDTFVQNAMEIMYSPEGKVQDEIMARLSTGNKPIDTLAQTLVWLVMMVEQDAKRAGTAISDDVLMHAAREIMEQLIEIAEALGLHEFKEAEIQGAWYNALDMYREANSDEGGRIDPEVASTAFQQLDEAAKEGRADEIVPGFEQNAERGMAMAQMDQNDPDAEEPEEKTLNRKDTANG